MEPSQVKRGIAAARSVAGELGFHVADAVVVYNSDRIAVRLLPGELLVRIGSLAHEEGFGSEIAVAHQLAAAGSPVGTLAAGAAPRVYVHDGFALSFWTYYASMGVIAPTDYAGALVRLHADLRQIDLAAPHVTERVEQWMAETDDPAQTPDLPSPERELLRTTLYRVRQLLDQCATGDQLLHGEPHPGNVLSTGSGPRFIDFHTCQRGPIAYDIAFLPEDAAALYPGADQHLIHQFRILMRAGFTTMRWLAADQFPDRDRWRIEGLNLLRAELARG